MYMILFLNFMSARSFVTVSFARTATLDCIKGPCMQSQVAMRNTAR